MVALLERIEASSCWVSVLVKHSARLSLTWETGSVAPCTNGNTRARPHKAMEYGSGMAKTADISWAVLIRLTFSQERRDEHGTVHV